MKLAIALAAFVFTAGTAQAATTLTFDGDVCSSSSGVGAFTVCNNFTAINQPTAMAVASM